MRSVVRVALRYTQESSNKRKRTALRPRGSTIFKFKTNLRKASDLELARAIDSVLCDLYFISSLYKIGIQPTEFKRSEESFRSRLAIIRSEIATRAART